MGKIGFDGKSDRIHCAKDVPITKPHWLKRIWRWFFPFKVTVYTRMSPDGKWRHLVLKFDKRAVDATVEAWLMGEKIENATVWQEGQRSTVILGDCS